MDYIQSRSASKTASPNMNYSTQIKPFPEALEQINLTQYRQVLAGQNRIIYEQRQRIVYIHTVDDTRRDMKTLLMRRLLRAET